MKTKIIWSNYDENTGISNVHIATELGVFKGKAKLHDEDKKIASNFAGCNIAEARAVQKYLQAKIKNVKEQIKGLKHLENVLKNINSYNPNSIENRKLRHQIYIKQSEIQQYQNRINAISDNIDTYLNQRLKLIKNKENEGADN